MAETPMLVNAVDYEGRPASRSDSGGWRSAALIIGNPILSFFFSKKKKKIMRLKVVIWYRCGGCWEVRILRDQLKPHKLSDWAARPINGGRGGKHQCMGRNDVVVASVGSFRGRFFCRPLPHHRNLFCALYFGLFLLSRK